MRNILLFLICSLGSLWAKTTLSIDQASKTIVAPDGVGYQWFINGEKVQGGTFKSLKVDKMGIYAVEVYDMSGDTLHLQSSLAFNAMGAIVTIYIIGDSTVCNYAASAYPQAGWGQVIGSFFNSSNIVIKNNAIGGRSSRSFYKQGRWDPVKSALVAGDYVFIQWGHNDRDYSDTSRYTSVADYKTYLTMYCKDTKAKGAIPVLISPMVMNAWTGTTMRNVFTETGNNYRGAMLEVATALDVAFVDLNMKSWNLYKTYGANYNTRFIYKGFIAGEYPNYPAGITDGTHFQEMGAICNARMIVQGIAELSSRADMAKLNSNLTPQYSVGIAVNPATGKDSMTTKTYTYPAGLTVTLKTIPKMSSTFQYWVDATNKQVSTATLTTVSSGSSATSYTAVYQGAIIATDCNNTPSGTATKDVCDRCVGGTTGKIACSSVGEAETDACNYSSGTTIDNNNAGFKGTGFVNVPNVVGSQITFVVNASSAGNKIISFRYAGSSDRPADLFVNGIKVNTLSFPSTGAFTTYVNTEVTLALALGNNVIQLVAVTTGGLANIDQIGYVSSGTSKGSCVVTDIENNVETADLQIYPNPTHGKVSWENEASWILQDANGHGLLKGNGKEIDLFNYSKGVYLLTIDRKTIKIINE